MRDLSCYLSSISIHTLVAALVTAAGLALPPDPGVTSGGVSISSPASAVAIDTRVEFETLPPPADEVSARNPFEAAPSDVVISKVTQPVLPGLEIPAAPSRPAVLRMPSGVRAEPLRVSRMDLLQSIDTELFKGREPAETVSTKFDASLESAGGQTPGQKATDVWPVTAAQAARNDRPAEVDVAQVVTAPRQPNVDPRANVDAVAKTPVSKTAVAQKPAPGAPARPEPPGARVDQPPVRLTTNPGPVYPREAWRQQQQGVVYLLVQVSGKGRADSVRVQRTSGFQLLDAAAEKTVRRWKFQPAVRAGKPVPSQVLVPIRFRILRQ
ncbi:MAG: TonB family protein [Planctomycetaceae bacterium]